MRKNRFERGKTQSEREKHNRNGKNTIGTGKNRFKREKLNLNGEKWI
jgi:hypothetical protein